MQAPSRSSAKTKPSSWVGPSHISIFIRNLKLVRLDDRADWPDINLHIFSSSTQQNQRQRIKCVEWALYYLFTIWDPETANNKLRPFFPPLEPLQSLNLRGALFRALSDLKKNGELGRETILRKSMLDDCKGDKFEEVLAVFSANVVRKYLSKNGSLGDNTVAVLSTASHLTPAKQDSLLPLVLAHRVSLGSILNDKTRLQGYYDEFRQHLDDKATELASRPGKHPEVSNEAEQDPAKIKRTLRDSWFGTEEWADAIIKGGVQLVTDNLFELPFEETWARVNKGELEGSAYKKSPDLLLNLDKRIELQKTRLQKWREFRTLLKESSESQPRGMKVKAASSPLLFRDHQTWTVASRAQSPRNSDAPHHCAEYENLVSAMNASLSDLKGDTTSSRVSTEISRKDIQKGIELPSSPADSYPPVPQNLPQGSFYGTSPIESPPERDVESSIASRGEHSLGDEDSPHTTHANIRIEKPELDSRDRKERTSRLDPLEEDMESRYQDSKLERLGLGSLLERTRQSMSLLPPPSAGSRQSINPKSSRQSQVFPINQFETPKKPSAAEPKSGATTPKEELFDADYASVFKSRPKIATSPVVSPAAHMQPLDGIDHTADFSLSEVDIGNSPSARTRV